MIPLHQIVQKLDQFLRIADIKDAPVALNGLQVENNGLVSRVALAVDGTQQTIESALAIGADLLLLHHGIFWSGLRPLTGWWKKKITTCLQGNLAVYAAHLPLDMHPELGNNACIARGLGLTDIRPEVDYHGLMIGLSGVYAGSIGKLKEEYARLTGTPVTGTVINAFAPAGRVALCSGAGGDSIYQLQAKGYHCFLTGEENHWVVNAAQDMGISILFAGHYATETFGVQALGEWVSQQWNLPTVFIDHPTGM